MKLMALGMFLFGIDTIAYSELQRRTAWRHAKSDRVQARPATQYLGPGEDTITLNGALIPELKGDRASLGELRKMADSGDSFTLLDGEGNVWGDYIIMAVDERHSHIFVDGIPRWIDFAIDLDRVN